MPGVYSHSGARTSSRAFVGLMSGRTTVNCKLISRMGGGNLLFATHLRTVDVWGPPCPCLDPWGMNSLHPDFFLKGFLSHPRSTLPHPVRSPLLTPPSLLYILFSSFPDVSLPPGSLLCLFLFFCFPQTFPLSGEILSCLSNISPRFPVTRWSSVQV